MKNFIFICLLTALNIATATASPLFEADISVDITAKTVAEAKQQAINKAVRDGLSEIVQNISSEKSVKELNQLNDNQLQHFITGIMVLMEKSSDIRYIADLRITADENILKAYMKENNMPLIIGENLNIYIAPLLEKADGSLDLWGDENIWRQAFLSHKNLQRANLNIQLLEKNLGNITAVKTNRIYDMTDGEYNELASFNNADSIYVLKYSLKDNKVYIKAFPKRETNEIAIGKETPEKMISKILPYIKDLQKENLGNQQTSNIEETLDVVYTYPKLSDWMSLKHILENTPQVSDINLLSIGNGKVHFNFKFNGIIEKLQSQLGLNGYHLHNEGEYYVIN